MGLVQTTQRLFTGEISAGYHSTRAVAATDSAAPANGEALIAMPEAAVSSSKGKKRDRGSPPAQTIDEVGSIALITNNISGPAMMGLPHLFHTAGIIPTAGTILAVCCCSSLCGTLLADTIQRIPGNRNFTKNINFSSAFRIIVGEDWYVFAETLFILSCMVQACASIVETAQSLDGFLASFVLGKTWAVQILPQPAFLQWSPEDCKPGTEFEVESGLEDCTPFHDAGDLVLTLGFVLTTLIFYPLGRGHLKETIVVQIVSFAILFVLLSQFFFEFWERGYDYVDTVPWFGTDFSQLAGVVLFNYAFSITVPSWLSEKMPHVSVNRTIWTSTILSSGIYISFGLLAACSFENAGPNMLILLSSSQVHFMTRVCAAIFGTSIIGCGVPVFCVIIKTALYSGGVCSKPWSQFFGALFPYCLSWMLYQGTMLMTVLNWTGLLVNGMVAFILPLVLALYASRRITANYVHIELATTSSTTTTAAMEREKSAGIEDDEDDENPNPLSQPVRSYYSHSIPNDPAQVACEEVSPLWECLEPARRQIILLIVAIFALAIFATVAIDWFVEDEPTDR